MSIFDKYQKRFWDWSSQILELEVPTADTLEGNFEAIFKYIKGENQGLDSKAYEDVRYVEMRDDDDYHEAVLHIFKPSGEYIIILNGNISRGKWYLLNGGFVINYGGREEFYQLILLNSVLFVLKKHGSPPPGAKRKYLMFGKEAVVVGKEWRDIMNALFNPYRTNYDFSGGLFWLILVIVLLLLMIFI